jgi:hypothetical protein
MTLEDVLDEVKRLSPNGGLVEITGGEPMLQEREVLPLMKQLLVDRYRVLLETSGERPLERVPVEVIKIVDVKCPNSGEPDTFLFENLATLTARDEVKFVLASHRLCVCPRLHPPTQSGRAGERRAVLARVSQRCHGIAGQFALPARSPGISGVDAGR